MRRVRVVHAWVRRACGWRACGRRAWAVLGFVQLRSVQFAAALRTHASGHGTGLIMRVPLGFSYWASGAR